MLAPFSPYRLTSREGGGVCLNMIVKDEQDVIARCLRSALPYISSYCIVDTGSTDRTKEIILETLKELPGRVLDFEWTGNFSEARNFAFEAALAQDPAYLMFMDADELLVIQGVMPLLACDAYLIGVHYLGNMENRYWMVRSDFPGRWFGAIHEDLPSHGSISQVVGTMIVSTPYGARAKNPEKRVQEDLDVLHEMIKKDPGNPRNWYYLGATYIVAKEYDKAAWAFGERAKMSGNQREIDKANAYLTYYNKEKGVILCAS